MGPVRVLCENVNVLGLEFPGQNQFEFPRLPVKINVNLNPEEKRKKIELSYLNLSDFNEFYPKIDNISQLSIIFPFFGSGHNAYP